MLESNISKQIIRWLNSLPNGRAIKLHASAMQGKGEPDIFASIGGRLVVIETKQRGKKPTELQAYILEQWRKTGAIALGGVTSLEEVQAALKDERVTNALVRSGH